MQLTPDQDKAAQAFISFLLDPQQQSFILSGMAGTGKTTLLHHLIWGGHVEKVAKLIGMRSPLKDLVVHFTATTNKAAEVLEQSLPASANVSTIHSLLGLRVYNDHASGRTRLVHAKNKTDVIRNALIFIDEASMVNHELLTLIDQGTFGCKFVFIGDHCQLAPVKESYLPVFAGALSNAAPQQDLVTQVRSLGAPGISALSRALREGVQVGQLPELIGAAGEVEYLDEVEAERKIQEVFGASQRADARILCFTNRKVIAFNQYLRNFRGLPPEPQPGEVLVSNTMTMVHSADKHHVHMYRPEQEIVLDSVGSQEIYHYGYDLAVYPITTHGGEVSALMAADVDDYHRLLKQISKAKDWPNFFHFKENIADLRARDAQTVHKSQGSTYETVFVDLSDIGTCTSNDQIRRMLYVACSRATKHVYLIGQLPARAFNPAT